MLLPLKAVTENVLGPGTGRATITDVAARAGVSIATVSRVVNASETVHPDTTRRVRAAMEDLRYVPHRAGRSLAGRTAGSLGVLLLTPSGASTEDVFFLEILRGLGAAAEGAGLTLTVAVRPRGPSAEADAEANAEATAEGGEGRAGAAPEVRSLRLLAGGHTDGLVIAGGPLPAPLREELRRTACPVVLCGPHEGAPGAWSVVADSRRGAESAVAHLFAGGRRRIAHIGGPLENRTAAWKREGFLAAHAGAGQPADPRLHVVAPALHSRDGGVRAAEALLEAGVAFDAVFANDDLLALGAMAVLRRRGLDVPEDVAVAGSGDLAEARFASPPLTSVHVDFAQQGWLAGTILVQAIKGAAPPAVQLKLETGLAVRESSRPAGGRREEQQG